MNKKNKILNIAITIGNVITMWLISKNTGYIDRMPDIENPTTIIDDILDFYIGRRFSTLVVAFIFTIVSFLINKFAMKEKAKTRTYILLFIIMSIFNIIIHRLCVRVVW